jgi:hypothetical protein
MTLFPQRLASGSGSHREGKAADIAFDPSKVKEINYGSRLQPKGLNTSSSMESEHENGKFAQEGWPVVTTEKGGS